MFQGASILTELDSKAIESVLYGNNDTEIQNQYSLHYKADLDLFVSNIGTAFKKWDELDKVIMSTQKEADALISALLFASIHSHVVSMKLFIMGLLVPSGNTQRYVLESISLALLMSRPSIGISKRYIEGKYSPNKAVRDVIKNCNKLNLNREGLATLENAMKRYHNYSHPSLLSIAGVMTVNPDNPRIIFGGEFDVHKDYIYKKELKSRVGLASIFPSIIDAVGINFNVET